ncbi:MAG: TldD/PmbA family protein [Deltaproteobacteria bacterium]|nr:TldD/PmbA family protein [Deltaproteobacteria bacterium]
MMAHEESQRVLTAAVEAAKQGVDGAEASLIGGSLGVTRFADNEVHQQTLRDREMLAVRVVVGGRVGRAETSDLTLQGLRHVARQARLMAELRPPPRTPFELPAPQIYQPIEAFDAETERATPLDRMSLAGKAIIAAHREKLSASGFVATRFGAVDLGFNGDGAYAIANSNGLFAYHTTTRATMSLTMASKSGASGWSEGESLAISRLDTDGLIHRAAKKALFAGEPRTLAPGPYPVILEPAAVASLMSFLALAVGAEQVEEGRSFLSGRIGERIAPETITVLDDLGHSLHRGPPFDADGVARRKVTVIDRGVARQPVYGLESARRHNAEPTGHRLSSAVFGETEVASHLVMEGGKASLADLVAACPRGVLVTRCWYVQVVDPRRLILTGVTRDGTFLIEGGELVAPIQKMRFNVSLLDLFERIEAMSEPEWASGLVVPGIRASELYFSAPAPS